MTDDELIEALVESGVYDRETAETIVRAVARSAS